MKKYSFLVFITLFAFLSSCEDSSKPQEIICSTISKSIGISLENSAGQPVTVDDYYTIQLSDGDTIREPMIEEGYYTVLNDNQHGKLVEKQDSFLFVGIKDSAVLVQETFVISGDQCHINKISGKSKVVLK